MFDRQEVARFERIRRHSLVERSVSPEVGFEGSEAHAGPTVSLTLSAYCLWICVYVCAQYVCSTHGG